VLIRVTLWIVRFYERMINETTLRHTKNITRVRGQFWLLKAKDKGPGSKNLVLCLPIQHNPLN
jgi:hypothetical protein